MKKRQEKREQGEKGVRTGKNRGKLHNIAQYFAVKKA